MRTFRNGKVLSFTGSGDRFSGGCEGNLLSLLSEDGRCSEKMKFVGSCSTVWQWIVGGFGSSTLISHGHFKTGKLVIDVDFLASLIFTR